MINLTITKAAREKIRGLLSGAPIEQPVVYLIETSGPHKVPPQVRDAIERGADESTIQELAAQHLPEDVKNSPRKLHAAVYPRGQLPSAFLLKIDDIVFYVPPQLAKKIDGCVLDVGYDGFEIRNADGAVVMPSR